MTMTWSPDTAAGRAYEKKTAEQQVRSAEEQDADETMRKIHQRRAQLDASGSKGVARKRRLIGR